MRSRQRVACWSLGLLALLPLADATAQSARRTTVGRLLGGPVDTIVVQEIDGGRRGGTGAWLQLVRVDSGYRGTLRLKSWVADLPHMSTDTSSYWAGRRCDTVMAATMPASAARRLLALLRPAVVEPGEAPDFPFASDVYPEYSYRLTSGSNAVVVRNARTLVHGETRYRTPLKRDRRARALPEWAALDMNHPLVKARGLLQPYLQLERLLAFSNACRAPSVPAQSLHPDSLFDRLVGNWVLRGTIARRPTTHDVTFAWMLGREYVQMHEVSRERAANGTPAYEAVVLFGRDPKTGEYGMLWMDNTAASAFDPAGIGRGRVAGDSIPFLFNYSATDAFHTTFVYDRAADTWQWHMDNDSAGVRKPFARVTLTRRQRG